MSTELETEPVQALEVRGDIQIGRAPERVIEEARTAAIALKDILAQKKNKFMFRGEQYLQFEDWQTLGRFYGVTARIKNTQQVSYGDATGFEASAEAVRADGMVISAAEAMCMDDEVNWKGKPIFQLRSMAQTRACAKALRNVLSWVAVLAGYAPTPAEEMTGHEDDHQSNSMPCPDCGGQMWDNRATKRGRQPDYKCKDQKCNKAVWLDSANKDVRRTKIQAVSDAFKVLNQLGADPQWTKRSANEFVSAQFEGLDGVDALDNAQLDSLLEILAKQITAAKEGGSGLAERDRLIAGIRSNFKTEKDLNSYMDENYEGKRVEDMTIPELKTVHDDVNIPF